jgi:uncharacterized protein
MTGARLIRYGDLKPTPWKNGGGETREIAAFPPGARLDDFLWRISMATVATDGPFSLFPGIDRVLTVVDGDGLDLDVDGVSHRLMPESAPLAFPGDVPAGARLVGGVVTDVNVMTQRGQGSASVTVLTGPDERRESTAEVVILLSRSERLEVTLEGTPHSLGRFDSLIGGAGVYRIAAADAAATALFSELFVT